jgi:uncharacterized paraquat-inducible protein A
MQTAFFCEACNENHSFDLHEIEQLMYILKADIAEAVRQHEGVSLNTDFLSIPGADIATRICLSERLVVGLDPDWYREEVENQVKQRRERQGLATCSNCGGDAPSKISKIPLCGNCHH